MGEADDKAPSVADFVGKFIDGGHVRSGLALSSAWFGATATYWSFSAPEPQQAVLFVLGVIAGVSGVAYIVWRTWER